MQPTQTTDQEEERAVSPVIGVILMVAITVILAAVIGAFVLDLGDSVSQEAQAGIDVSTSDDTATVSWVSEGNSEDIDISVEIIGTDNPDVSDASSQYSVSSSGQLTSVGGTESFSVSPDSEGDDSSASEGDEVELRIISTGNIDDTSTVVSDETVTVIASS